MPGSRAISPAPLSPGPAEASLFGSDGRSGKPELRRGLLSARRALDDNARAQAAERVRATLLDLVRRERPSAVAAYVPAHSEPGGADLAEILARELPAGGLLLPVLRRDHDLDWAPYGGPDSLAPAGRGLREPRGPALGRSAVSAAQLVIVPALAVDLAGRRLGRGGGSYDRALARVGAGALTVALLHDGELLDVLPTEPHDRPVRAVITPTGGLRVLDPPPRQPR